jgi:hypothetical protein
MLLWILLGVIIFWDAFYFVFLAWKINSRQAKIRMKERSLKSKLSLKSKAVKFEHLVRFYEQKVNYYVHVFLGIFYCIKVFFFPIHCSFSRNVKLLLGSPGLMTFLTDFQVYEKENKALMTWKIRKVRIPCAKDELSDVEIVAGLLFGSENGECPQGRFLKFLMNEIELCNDHAGQATVLVLVASMGTHPAVHGYFNILYEQYFQKLQVKGELDMKIQARRLKTYERLILHGSFLNEVANWFPGFLVSETPDFIEKLLESNCSSLVPSAKHSLLLSDPRLYVFSPVTRFIVESRRLTLHLMHKHKVPLDPELVFIASIIHFFEHQAMKSVQGSQLIGVPHGKKQSSFLLCWYLWMFCIPLPTYLTSNCLKDHHGRNAFYYEWYTELCKIDKRYADKITLSLSY